MSIPVELEELVERIGEFGALAYLVTVGADAHPHVVSVTVRWRDDGILVGAGRRTSANVATNADVTLLWPARQGAAYALLVDGAATITEVDGEATLAIRPAAAVLHRVAGADPSIPSCVTVLATD